MKNEHLRREAADRGDVHFTSPITCKACGGQLRYTSSNQCVPCKKEVAARRNDDVRRRLRSAKMGKGTA